MSLDGFVQSILHVLRDHVALAEPFVFALGLGEGIPGLSLLIPSTALFLAIGGIHGAAGGAFWHLWLAATAGAVAGDCIAYGLGRWLKDDVARLKYFAIHPDALSRGHDAFERWGSLAVLGGKFTGFLRPFIPVVAGVLAMPWPVFLVSSILSSAAWSGVFLAPGYGMTLMLK